MGRKSIGKEASDASRLSPEAVKTLRTTGFIAGTLMILVAHLADVLADCGQELYTDFSGVHLNGTGNAIVAESLYVWITMVAPEVLAYPDGNEI